MDPRTGQILTAPGAANTAGGDRHADPGHGQSAERHPPGRRRHRQDRLHLADARARSALRRGLRPDRQPDHGHPRRRRSVLRPSGRQHRVRHPGQPADRDLARPAQRPACRRSVRASASCRFPACRPSSTTPKSRRSGSGRPACSGRCRGRWWPTSRTSATTASTGLGALQNGSTINLNAVDIGAAYLPQNQDPTIASPARCRAPPPTPPTCCKPYPRLRQHQPEHHRLLGHLPLDPDVAEPPLPQRLLVRCELHLRDLVQGHTGLQSSVCSTRRTAAISAACRPGASTRS